MDTTVKPSAGEFAELAKSGNVVPVYAQLAADFETPVSAFLKLRDGKHAFLFESAESTDASGRWSIVGSNPKWVFVSKGDQVTIHRDGQTEQRAREGDVLEEVERLMSGYCPVTHGNAPPFFGGAVGYVGYDAVQQFEPAVGASPEDDLGLPESVFFLSDTLVVFDHKMRRLLVVANALLDEHESPAEAYAHACGQIGKMIEMLDRPLHVSALNGLAEVEAPSPKSNTTQKEYEQMVRFAQEYITAGDAFQIVPSQRFEADFDGEPIDLYRASRGEFSGGACAGY